MTQPTFLATLELIFLHIIELYGLDAKAFMRQIGIDVASPPDSKSRMSTQIADQCFGKAMALIPDPAFGLRAAECWHPSNLGALGYAWLSSATLHTGLDRLARYSHMLGQKSAWRCNTNGRQLLFVLDNQRDDSDIKYAMTDFSMSIVIDMCRKNAGIDFHPVSVCLRRPAPVDPKPYMEFYRCTVQFGADQDSFTVDRSVADAPLPSSNQELAITFDAILAEQLAALDKANTIARCKHFFLMELTSGEPTEQALAKALGMSLRGLQRKLAEDGTSYSRLFDEVRHELAQSYLARTHRSVNEITFLLGYSGQSAFTRAFKRWNGKSPSDYRAENSALS